MKVSENAHSRHSEESDDLHLRGPELGFMYLVVRNLHSRQDSGVVLLVNRMAATTYILTV